MFKTTTDLGPIPDEMTKDADKDHTISPLPPVPMSEITPIPQQRILTRTREPEILGTSPLFVSQGGRGVGSIYYAEGRIRLFHPMGRLCRISETYLQPAERSLPPCQRNLSGAAERRWF